MSPDTSKIPSLELDTLYSNTKQFQKNPIHLRITDFPSLLGLNLKPVPPSKTVTKYFIDIFLKQFLTRFDGNSTN